MKAVRFRGDNGEIIEEAEIPAELLAEAEESGVRHAVVTGGEPLLRHGLADLVARIAGVDGGRGVAEVKVADTGVGKNRVGVDIAGSDSVAGPLDDDQTARRWMSSLQPAGIVLCGAGARSRGLLRAGAPTGPGGTARLHARGRQDRQAGADLRHPRPKSEGLCGMVQ